MKELEADSEGLWAPPGWEKWAPGETLRARRRFAGLSQVDLGRLCGLRPATISLIENGGDARIDTVLKIAEALGCELVVRLRPRPGAAAILRSPGRGWPRRYWGPR